MVESTLGAINSFSVQDEKKRNRKNKSPKKGVEIFIFINFKHKWLLTPNVRFLSLKKRG
jgi:hypothetical protein